MLTLYGRGIVISYDEHILVKVFSLLSLIENVEVFKTEGQTNGTHFLYSYVALHVLCMYLILFKCGVLHRLFQFRSFHNLRLDKRNQLHTFFLLLNTHHRGADGFE